MTERFHSSRAKRLNEHVFTSISKKENNFIEESIKIEVGISKIWQALVDYKKFEVWFDVKLNSPFIIGKRISGYSTAAKFKDIRLEFVVKEIKFEKLFSYKWHPYAINPEVDYSKEESTLVEFELKELPFKKVSLLVRESGFENLPEYRKVEAYNANSDGWRKQLKNIELYLRQRGRV